MQKPKRKNLKIANIVLLFFLLSIGTVKNLNAQLCQHTPRCVFDSCHYGGNGLSKATAFQIWSKAHLEELADSVNNSTVPNPNNWSTGKYFALMNDITDSVRTVIGSEKTGSTQYSFQGNFNGNNFKVTVSINKPTDIAIGTFGYCTDGCVIENLNVDGIVMGYVHVGGVVGNLAGSNSIIKNCNNYASLKSIERTLGGIVGINNNGKILNCNNYGAIEHYSIYSNYVGGIVGHNHYGNNHISNCVNNESVHARGWEAGGIVGRNVGIVEFCVNIGTITSTSNITFSSNCGGIVGCFASWGVIYNNTNYGFVYGGYNIGGVIGKVDYINVISNAIVINNSNFGVVEGLGNVGCIVGLKGTSTNIIIENNHYDKQMCGAE